jgi:hypothetical protein
MNLQEVNKQLSRLNPYTEKDEIRELLKTRRRLIKEQDKKGAM